MSVSKLDIDKALTMELDQRLKEIEENKQFLHRIGFTDKLQEQLILVSVELAREEAGGTVPNGLLAVNGPVHRIEFHPLVKSQ